MIFRYPYLKSSKKLNLSKSIQGDKMTVTTKTGDAGTSGILGKQRVSKSDQRMEAVGTIDELSAFLGLCATNFNNSSDPSWARIITIQKDLYRLNAEVASEDPSKLKIMLIGNGDVVKLETWISEYEEEIEPLKAFVLPGGGNQLSGLLDVSRTVCRRAERKLVGFLKTTKTEDNDYSILKYLNRLSDLLFLMARVYETQRIYATKVTPRKRKK